ncbi:MAG: AzlD domain-containing protein [Spirochaetaceae bacterium]|nr:AzlD domain-containing protein [Spirochaetaceae bacterium]
MNIYAYIFIGAIVTYAIRVLPLTLITRPIKNRFLRSFLYYVPYITLSVMTFPAIIEQTDNLAAGIIALIAGIALSYLGAGLFPVALSCCAVVLISELFF